VSGVAPSTWAAFQERLARLYEQNAPLEEIRRGVELYVRHWRRWVMSGVLEVSFSFGSPDCEALSTPLPSHEGHSEQPC
jgi:hypothetical protein